MPRSLRMGGNKRLGSNFAGPIASSLSFPCFLPPNISRPRVERPRPTPFIFFTPFAGRHSALVIGRGRTRHAYLHIITGEGEVGVADARACGGELGLCINCRIWSRYRAQTCRFCERRAKFRYKTPSPQRRFVLRRCMLIWSTRPRSALGRGQYRSTPA